MNALHTAAQLSQDVHLLKVCPHLHPEQAPPKGEN